MRVDNIGRTSPSEWNLLEELRAAVLCAHETG